MRHAALILALLLLPALGQAEERVSLGWGSIINNDYIGDGRDRYRTGSVVVSHLRGPAWTGARPTGFGELVELRFRIEAISPRNVATPPAGDRPYVGAVSLGAHTHFQRGGAEMSLGLDLVVVGPQTGVDDLQDGLHDLFGVAGVNVDGNQIEDGVYPTVTFEVGRAYALGAAREVRPFVELQAGAETLARVGADVTLGAFGQGGLLLRDSTTGQRYLGIKGAAEPGLSFTLGADVAYVADSQFLDAPGIEVEHLRARARLGLHQQWQRGSLFYGATYLSEEFESQPEGQVVGSVNAQFNF
ncbi:uncharacterized protein DUF2219 [Litoreibacter ponti]|uniref:Uncharacterized protein DUF2219 n=1 Tax=Litoreibacter ponti TaxID=1510457 RepID=A0A2T6BLJ9_9RHOB|nr:lipid A-modifier LpxR family protein [Litoreibacter ponti]PTX56941.1 uncharacterized protein DUF2219 [Litoreibacter ponti]